MKASGAGDQAFSVGDKTKRYALQTNSKPEVEQPFLHLLLNLDNTELSNSFQKVVSSGTLNKFRHSWGGAETLFNMRLQVGNNWKLFADLVVIYLI